MCGPGNTRSCHGITVDEQLQQTIQLGGESIGDRLTAGEDGESAA
jgi:hypothetical protein